MFWHAICRQCIPFIPVHKQSMQLLEVIFKVFMVCNVHLCKKQGIFQCFYAFAFIVLIISVNNFMSCAIFFLLFKQKKRVIYTRFNFINACDFSKC